MISFNNNKYLIHTIKPNYYIASNISRNIQVYTEDDLDYGDIIKVDETGLNEPYKSLSTYSYNSLKYLKENNIKYSTKTYEFVHHIPNISSLIYKRISKVEDAKTKSILNKLIFNISDYELLNDFILESGLNYYGLTLILMSIFEYFFKKAKANKLTNYVLLILFIINPCYQALRFIIYRFISLLSKEKYQSFGIMTLMMMLLNPYKVTSVSFLFPTIIRLFSLTKSKETSYITLIIFLNGFFFNQVDLLKVLFFKFLAIINGLFTLLAIITIPIFKLNTSICNLYGNLTNILSKLDFTINGHTGILTLIFYISLFKTFKIFKHKDIAIMTLLVFLNMNNIYGSVSFINVGHGDATLIKTPFNKEIILIDCGSSNNYYRLKNYLVGKGVSKIDYLLLTHNDEDHSGNLDNLLIDYVVDNVISSKDDITNSEISLLQLNSNIFEEENTNSNCYYTKINGLAYLFTGDIDAKAESSILKEFNNLDIDILKVAHHGSKTSSSPVFIKQISPIISIISCSNKYNFPSNETIETLKNNKSKILLTKEVGDIEIIQFLNFNILRTSDNNYIFIN